MPRCLQTFAKHVPGGLWGAASSLHGSYGSRAAAQQHGNFWQGWLVLKLL